MPNVEDVVELLLTANVGINKPRKGDGSSSIMMACHNGHIEIVRILMESGADVMLGNKMGLNAFGCAAMAGHLEIVKLLYEYFASIKDGKELDLNALVDYQDGVNGWTPLMSACQNGHLSTVQLLVNRNCDINLKNKVWVLLI